MSDATSVSQRLCPQAGDVILFGKAADGKGDVNEVPAIILGVRTAGDPESRVDLKTFEIGHEMEPRRDVKFSPGPRPGCWRWRPGR